MMDKIQIKDKVFKPFIPNDELIAAIEKCAEKVNNDFERGEEVPIVLCVLNGAIFFTVEMMKRFRFPCELVSIKLSSYVGTQSTGKVMTTMGLTADVKGRTVIVSEDIVDSGRTIVALKQLLLEAGAKEVKIATMLLKPEVYNKPDKLDYVAMEIPDRFIVGFGLDYDELGRNYPDIYILDR